MTSKIVGSWVKKEELLDLGYLDSVSLSWILSCLNVIYHYIGQVHCVSQRQKGRFVHEMIYIPMYI